MAGESRSQWQPFDDARPCRRPASGTESDGMRRWAGTAPAHGPAGNLTMCIGYPARVLSFDSTDASVEMDGRRRHASMVLRPRIAVGDWVLVAAGTVIRRLDAEEAHDLRRTIDAAVAASPQLQRTPGGPR